LKKIRNWLPLLPGGSLIRATVPLGYAGGAAGSGAADALGSGVGTVGMFSL
jgi:hypothetical protein